MIGEVVVDLGFADRDTVEEAVASARAQGRPTGLVLVEQGVLRHDQLARVVAERFGLDYIDLAVYDLDMGAVNLLSAEAAKRYQAVPVGFADDGALLLAMADPTNVLTIDDIAMMTGRRVRPAAASVEDLEPAARAARRGWTSRSKTSSTRRPRPTPRRICASRTPTETRRSSSSSIRSSPRRSSRAPRTST